MITSLSDVHVIGFYFPLVLVFFLIMNETNYKPEQLITDYESPKEITHVYVLSSYLFKVKVKLFVLAMSKTNHKQD